MWFSQHKGCVFDIIDLFEAVEGSGSTVIEMRIVAPPMVQHDHGVGAVVGTKSSQNFHLEFQRILKLDYDNYCVCGDVGRLFFSIDGASVRSQS